MATTPTARTVALVITHDRGMLIVNQAGNAGTFVLATPDDLSHVAETLRQLCDDVSIKAAKVGQTSIDWGDTLGRVLGALGAPDTSNNNEGK